jgi:UDP-N-acetylglucosamine 2-epimerase
MPVSATTTLPTTSNVERREELEDMPVASPESNAVTVNENANLTAVAKKRIATGTTAKALQQCQEEMKEYRKTLEKRQENQDHIITQILDTYRSIKDRQEKHFTAMENHRKEVIEQRQRRNYLLEEKNNLLKEFLNSLKKE